MSNMVKFIIISQGIYWYMKYIITTTQFDRILDLYLKRYLGETPNVVREENPYREGSYSLKISRNKNSGNVFNFIFTAPGESWDDPSDIILPENSVLYVRNKLVDDLIKLLNVRETKVLDLIADWFTKKYNVDVDYVSK